MTVMLAVMAMMMIQAVPDEEEGRGMDKGFLGLCCTVLSGSFISRCARLSREDELELVGAVSCSRSVSLTSLAWPASALAPYTPAENIRIYCF